MLKSERRDIARELDELLRQRWHGAVNIRGIRYQLLYSVLRGMDLYLDGTQESIRLEGIEDVDLLGFHSQGEYVQLKTSQDPWTWSDLKKPLQGFLEAFRQEEGSSFRLVVDFPLVRDVARLAEVRTLKGQEEKRIRKKFRELCKQLHTGAERKATSAEADALLDRLTIESVPESEIWQQLRLQVADAFELSSDAVHVYIQVLVERFLEWAKDRRTVTRQDLAKVRERVGEALARETSFAGYGQGLIDRVVWLSDLQVDDFYEGKETRPGHIASGADVVRTHWLERIDDALAVTSICVLRSSSGQGKSTLQYRYAHDYWPADSVFTLRVAQTTEHVELVRNYLQFRASLGIPILLLVDNAGWRTPLWPLVAQECAALGVRVLVTVRNEDWHRFSRRSLTSYEVIEPSLNLDEARQIFDAFRSKGKLHPAIDSAEWAYDRVGELHLLMEYVYLLTHGAMLEERLQDQVQEIRTQGEDPAKIEVLRRVAVADALGAPVSVEGLLAGIEFTGDPQQALLSLDGEYLRLDDRHLTGLHWVRSDHLTRILHEKYRNMAHTALAVLDAVDVSDIPIFVANAMCREDVDAEVFLAGLVDRARDADLELVLPMLDGLFLAGERRFFLDNQSIFDIAYAEVGSTGPYVLGLGLLPLTSLNVISDLARETGSDNFRLLQQLQTQVRQSESDRGLDLCRKFLQRISPNMSVETLRASPGNTGRLLDWLGLCGVTLPLWSEADVALLDPGTMLALDCSDFCNLAQGVYRYDEETWRCVFFESQDDILGYLRLHLGCLALQIAEDSVSMEFVPRADADQDPHGQTIGRMHALRSAIPFGKQYKAQGLWPEVFGLKPSVDATRKEISVDQLPFESDAAKNAVWTGVVQTHYLPDSYHQYEEGWHNLRTNAIQFVKGLTKGLKRVVAGRAFNPETAFEDATIVEQLLKALTFLQSLPDQATPQLREEMKAADTWASSLRNFVHQVFTYMQDPSNGATGRLAANNFLNTVTELPQMHAAFDSLFGTAFDYFQMRSLNDPERQFYVQLADVLDVWIVDPPGVPVEDVPRYAKERRDCRKREELNALRNVAQKLRSQGIDVVLPPEIQVDGRLRSVTIGFSVADPTRALESLGPVLDALVSVQDLAHFFYLIPTHHDSRFIDGGYHISGMNLYAWEQGEFEMWEALVPRPIPTEAFECFPNLPFHASCRLDTQTAVASTLNDLTWLARLRERIADLGESRNRFDQALYQRETVKLAQLGRALSQQANAAKERLLACCRGFEESDGLRAVQVTLERLEGAANNGTLAQILVDDMPDVKSVLAALRSLLDQVPEM
jgi:hypothetical protein